MALILSGSIDAQGSATKPQYVGTASFAATASYALNAGGATFDTGSLITTASAATNVVTFTKGDASTFDITVQTGSIPAGTVSSSAQTIANLQGTDIISGSSQLPSGIVSSSAQTIANLPAGTVSSSAQLPSDIVSSSAQTIANLSGTDIISSSAQLPSGLLSSSVQVSDITASSIVNAQTSSVAEANEIVFTKGDGSTFSLTQDTSSFVKSVNGILPTPSNGNVPVSIGSVETGTSASMLAASSSGTLNDGDIWVISGQSGSDPNNGSGSNGQSYIFASSSGLLLIISGEDLASTDARYVQQSGDTMTGQLILSADPTNVLGAAPKQYVDVAYTGSLITSASDGTQTLTLRTKGGADETHTWTTSSFAISASHAAYSILADAAQDIVVNVRNTSGGTLAKGTPVYGTGATGDNINVSAASASVASTMPAIGLLTTDLANNANGNVILAGKLIGIDTSGFTAGNNVYVAPTGGLSPVRPDGDGDFNLVQNMAIVGKVNASEGEVVVVGSGRSNDVPNILSGSAWVGSSNGVATPVPTASFLVNTSSFSTTASYAVTASYSLNAAGGGGNISTPIINGVVTKSIEQGDTATFTGLSIASGNPAMWAILNEGYMTASLGTTNNISITNTVTTNEEFNITGSFSSSLYAQTALGRSVASQLLVNVETFTLSSSKAFGNDLSRYYLLVESDSATPPPGNYVYWGNGVINNSTSTLDVENSTGITGIDTRDYAVWYNATSTGDKMLALEYTSGGTLDSFVSFNVADYENTTTNQSATGISTVTSNEKLGGKLFDKYVGTGYYQITTPQSDYYLEISGSGGLFNSFGTKANGDWMFGFNLLDDWTIGNSGLQMLAPSGSENGAFVFAPGSYYITTSESDFITYGDHDTKTDTTTGITWASTNGVMAASGSSIIVYFDDATDTTYLYVDAVQKVSNTLVDTYMISSTTTDPLLNFGNPANRGENNYTNEKNVINFPYRINNLWVANTGTTLDNTDVSELASHSDISDSTNYASIDFHSQDINTTPDKGTAVISRKKFTRPS